jgi:CRP/FNR family cyclic AMP-dependent transcriptional regulator
MIALKKEGFDPTDYLSKTGLGRRIVRHKKKETIFVQGAVADSVSYLHSGRAKLSVVSKRGKEATVTLLSPGDFMGEEALIGNAESRKATASAITPCITMKIDKHEMSRVLREEHSFSDFFVQFMLERTLRTQADLVDQLFNSSERRLARMLLLMADYGKLGEPATLIPNVTQETLAEMIGTTRSRVSFFMNRFRKLGYIEYKGRIRVNKSLLNIVLHDDLPEENASRPVLLDPSPSAARSAKRSKIA